MEGETKRTDGQDAEHELRVEAAHSEAEAAGILKSEIIQGAYDVLQNGHLDAIVVEDDSGQPPYVHEVTREESNDVERALWSAGESMELTFLVNRILDGLKKKGFNLASTELRVHLRARE